MACQLIGKGKNLGRDLADVTKRRTDEWLTKWLRSPQMMLGSDAIAKAVLKEYGDVRMPNQSLSDTESRQYIKYFHWNDAQPPALATTSVTP